MIKKLLCKLFTLQPVSKDIKQDYSFLRTQYGNLYQQYRLHFQQYRDINKQLRIEVNNLRASLAKATGAEYKESYDSELESYAIYMLRNTVSKERQSLLAIDAYLKNVGFSWEPELDKVKEIVDGVLNGN